tara:strand:- start:461 stop:916 length:456 start_codon:yes stop_codon:yes gene_type:complete
MKDKDSGLDDLLQGITLLDCDSKSVRLFEGVFDVGMGILNGSGITFPFFNIWKYYRSVTLDHPEGALTIEYHRYSWQEDGLGILKDEGDEKGFYYLLRRRRGNLSLRENEGPDAIVDAIERNWKSYLKDFSFQPYSLNRFQNGESKGGTFY